MPSEGKKKIVPYLTVVFLLLFISPVLIISFLPKITTNAIMFFIISIAIGIASLRIGVWPTISSNTTKKIEIMITNQRVLIYPSPYAEKGHPKIIYLYEVNGEIELKHNRAQNTGSIYIPSPHWERLHIGNTNYPDIKDIKNPFEVYDILKEAIETGKRTKWK